MKNTPGELPLPWSEKDPYKLPLSIDKVQRMLHSLGGSERQGPCGHRSPLHRSPWTQTYCPACVGWEKPWIEQIVDRIMKGMLRTTEERATGVVSLPFPCKSRFPRLPSDSLHAGLPTALPRALTMFVGVIVTDQLPG